MAKGSNADFIRYGHAFNEKLPVLEICSNGSIRLLQYFGAENRFGLWVLSNYASCELTTATHHAPGLQRVE